MNLLIFKRIALELSRVPRFGRFAAAILQQTIALTALPLFVQLTKVLVCTYDENGGILDDYAGDLKCWKGKKLNYK